MKCSAVVPWEWALVPHRMFHEVLSSSTVGVFNEVLSSSTWELVLVSHRVFHEVFSSSTVGAFNEVFCSSTVAVGVSPSESVS